jgi:hypothetical protein
LKQNESISSAEGAVVAGHLALAVEGRRVLVWVLV